LFAGIKRAPSGLVEKYWSGPNEAGKASRPSISKMYEIDAGPQEHPGVPPSLLGKSNTSTLRNTNDHALTVFEILSRSIHLWIKVYKAPIDESDVAAIVNYLAKTKGTN
jgi:hypothetical protein